MQLITEMRDFRENIRRVRRDRDWRFVCYIVAVYSAFSILVGIAYLPIANIPDVLPNGLAIVSEVISPTIWGACWVVLGVWGVFASITGMRSTRVFVAMFALSVAWALVYIGGYIFAGGRGYLAVSVYFRAAVTPLLIILFVSFYKGVKRRGR